MKEIILNTEKFIKYIDQNPEVKNRLEGGLDELSPQKTPEFTLCFDPDEIDLTDSLDGLMS